MTPCAGHFQDKPAFVLSEWLPGTIRWQHCVAIGIHQKDSHAERVFAKQDHLPRVCSRTGRWQRAWPTVNFGRYDRNAMKRPHPTAKKRPTISGLYDAHGNLYEWTFDRIDQPQLPSLLVDFLGSEVGNGRILRGGSWPYAADRSRSAYRDDDDPYSSGSSFGFRLALTPSELPVRIKGD